MDKRGATSPIAVGSKHHRGERVRQFRYAGKIFTGPIHGRLHGCSRRSVNGSGHEFIIAGIGVAGRGIQDNIGQRQDSQLRLKTFYRCRTGIVDKEQNIGKGCTLVRYPNLDIAIIHVVKRGIESYTLIEGINFYTDLVIASRPLAQTASYPGLSFQIHRI